MNHDTCVWGAVCARRDQGEARHVHKKGLLCTAMFALALTLAIPPLAEAQKFTMLVDPRGLVHASCGILPAKAIGIPPDQYAKALQTLAVTFLTAPILTGAGEKLRVPLPAEPGHAWSWLEKKKGAWVESVPGPVTLEATFAEAQTIREGWLKLTKIEEGL